MKIKINRNILWTNLFVGELEKLGVKYACISPGSRSTPLTYAFAERSKIKCFVNIDERSSAFFALGLAKASNSPVVLVCTSGTAVAEFYPAIIEAYQNRVPLIICTADRPPDILNRGANQTINQNNIYTNHIISFYNAGLPEVTAEKLNYISWIANKSFSLSIKENRGPVHINFPFKKPFEPDNFTDEIEDEILNFNVEYKFSTEKNNDVYQLSNFNKVLDLIKESNKGLIIVGPNESDLILKDKLTALAVKLNVPILADGCSNFRFGDFSKENVIVNFEGFLRSEKFLNENEPDYILHFGRTSTSKSVEFLLERFNSPRFSINKFGDIFDAANKSEFTLAMEPVEFCEKIFSEVTNKDFSENKKYLEKFLNAEKISDEIYNNFSLNYNLPIETEIINKIIKNAPDECNIFISNSMPVRDFDYFANKSHKNILVYNNRGASGIDGIISTALGISESTKKVTILITGDLAFYYDLNAILISKKYKIPLIVILINNNGGGIFEMLPIARHKNIFDNYFRTPHNLNFENLVSAYGAKYFRSENISELKNLLETSSASNNFNAIEIRTDSERSASQRKNYWNEIIENL